LAEKEIVIRLRLPLATGRKWLLALCVAILAGTTVAYATVSNPFTSNQILTAASLNTPLNDLQAQIAILIPPGTVVAFAGSTAPPGWLLCDGRSVSRATYPLLFTAIGITHGQGNTSAEFRLPDYRGRFLRGVDGTAGRDVDVGSRAPMAVGGASGNAVGSVQGDAFGSHTHAVNDPGHQHHIFGQQVQFTATGSQITLYLTSSIDNGPNTVTSQTGISMDSTGAGETRPVNANVNFMIKCDHPS